MSAASIILLTSKLMAKYLVMFLITIDVVIAIAYLVNGSVAKFIYWLSAASISFSTLLMK